MYLFIHLVYENILRVIKRGVKKSPLTAVGQQGGNLGEETNKTRRGSTLPKGLKQRMLILICLAR
jgi:hypothetical protein